MDHHFSTVLGSSVETPAVGVDSSSVVDDVPIQSFTNPSYAEMILSGIRALNEEDGSSKKAISKFIESNCSGLSRSHSLLLTHHLKRLKNSGILVMNKKSYMLATRSDPIPATGSLHTSDVAGNRNHSTSLAPGQEACFDSSPVLDPYQALPSAAGSSLLRRGRGRPPKVAQQSNIKSSPLQLDENLAAGSGQVQVLGSSGVKRSRGRPPKEKILVQPQMQLDDNLGTPSEQKESPSSFLRHDSNQVQSSAGSSAKRGRGRPPKYKSPGQQSDASIIHNLDEEMKEHDAAHPVFVALGLVDDPIKTAKRSRGRPRKLLTGEGGFPIAGVSSQQGGVKRGRGRPPKSSINLNRFKMIKFLTAGGKKQRGRPPKFPRVAVAGSSKSTGRSVGRPRKNPLVTLVDANSSANQVDSNEDMKRKLEFFQSKIMEAVSVLKPEFISQSSVDAMAAIQELEGLASMDVTKPFQELEGLASMDVTKPFQELQGLASMDVTKPVQEEPTQPITDS